MAYDKHSILTKNGDEDLHQATVSSHSFSAKDMQAIQKVANGSATSSDNVTGLTPSDGYNVVHSRTSGAGSVSTFGSAAIVKNAAVTTSSSTGKKRTSWFDFKSFGIVTNPYTKEAKIVNGFGASSFGFGVR